MRVRAYGGAERAGDFAIGAFTRMASGRYRSNWESQTTTTGRYRVFANSVPSLPAFVLLSWKNLPSSKGAVPTAIALAPHPRRA